MDWPISWQKIKDNTSGGNTAPSPLYIKESKEISWDGQTDGMQEMTGCYRICEWLSKDQLLGAQISAVCGNQEYTGTIISLEEYNLNPSSFQYPVFTATFIDEMAAIMLCRNASDDDLLVLQSINKDIDTDEDGIMDAREGTWSCPDDPETGAARLSYLKTIQSVAIVDGCQEFFTKYQNPKHIAIRIPYTQGASEYTQMIFEECEGLNALFGNEEPFELEVKWGNSITTREYPTIYKDTSDGSTLFICGAFILKYTSIGGWYIKNRTL